MTIVTVQSAACSNAAIGVPTMLERPRTTASAPADPGAPSGLTSGTPAACTGQDREARPQAPDIDRVKPVDVLLRVDRQHHPMNVDLRRQRQLHENAVDRFGGVETRNLRDQVGLAGVRGRRRSNEPKPAAAQASVLART